MPDMNAKQTSIDTSQPADDARKPRSDGEQSRLRLLEAAMRLFGEQGFSKTSTREIAQKAKTPPANAGAIPTADDRTVTLKMRTLPPETKARARRLNSHRPTGFQPYSSVDPANFRIWPS